MVTPYKLDESCTSKITGLLQREYDAFYFYNAAENYYNNIGCFIAAKWAKEEAEDELKHAKILESYLVGWNITPNLPKIDKPKIDFKTPFEVIDMAYTMEHDLYLEYEGATDSIFKEGEMSTFTFLQQFLVIQTESVAKMSDKINILEDVEKTKINFLLLEKKLF